MAESAESILGWLKRERRTNEVEMGLMAHWFDLDGALASGQPELAWRTREVILVAGVELYLRRCGLTPSFNVDHVDRIRVMLRHLGTVQRELAGTAWDLVLRELPPTDDEMRRGVQDVAEFLRDRLNVRSAASRGEAIRTWADGAKLLRDVGRRLGAAGSDEWYLAEADSALDWHADVLAMSEKQT